MQRVDPRPYIYAGDVLLAKTYRTTLHNRLTQEIGEANAALIAAAPDLLAAAEGVLPWLAGINTNGDPAMVDALTDVYMQLAAAIKKAKGQ